MPDLTTENGSPAPRSAGPLLFHPDVAADGGAVLFLADVAATRVLAVELPPEAAAPEGGAEVRVEQLGAKLASLLGVERGDVLLRGLAVHPASRAAYLSVARGRGTASAPALVRAGADGQLSVVAVDALGVTSFDLDDAPTDDDDRQDFWLDGADASSQVREIHGVELQVAQVPLRRSTITGLAWVDGALLVAGSSNEEFSSRLRRVAYPFEGPARGTSVEIYHVDHGAYETRSPIRSLIGFDGGTSVLATYTCTPVVHFPVADLAGEGLVRGRTVAELGPMNQPFSLVSYERDGEEFLLVSGTRHPLLKIPASSVAGQAPLTQPRTAGDVDLGVPREELDHAGVSWMASLGRDGVLVVQEEDGDLHLRTLAAAQL